jgi:N-acetylgalactosamine kinase
MYESHESCARDYDISIPELDTLVSIAEEAGALGARLTGAGFGGCTVNFLRDTEVGSFIAEVDSRYYHTYLSPAKKDRIRSVHLPEYIFVCKALRGAARLFA